MTLYAVQRFLFDINRHPDVQREFRSNAETVLERYDLNDEERDGLFRGDIGLLYVLGVNGQLLMHFAAFLDIAWPDYIRSMRDGVSKYGPVRDGIYAMTTSSDDKVAGI